MTGSGCAGGGGGGRECLWLPFREGIQCVEPVLEPWCPKKRGNARFRDGGDIFIRSTHIVEKSRGSSVYQKAGGALRTKAVLPGRQKRRSARKQKNSTCKCGASVSVLGNSSRALKAHPLIFNSARCPRDGCYPSLQLQRHFSLVGRLPFSSLWCWTCPTKPMVPRCHC